jgi:hypothetical protein
MKTCPNCSHRNREGFLYCEECGHRIDKEGTSATLPTRKLAQSADEPVNRATWGTARFDPHSSIIIHIRDAAEPLILEPHQEIVFGRIDSNSIRKPDLDLTPYGALEKGVSRIHAAIYRHEDTLTLVDMGSANGTHLNGQRLSPSQPRVLRDGDEIRLGMLVAHIYFKGNLAKV